MPPADSLPTDPPVTVRAAVGARLSRIEPARVVEVVFVLLLVAFLVALGLAMGTPAAGAAGGCGGG